MNWDKGRKYQIACWGMSLLTILLVSSIVLSFLDKDIGALIGLGSVLALTPSAYMGANAIQKNNMHENGKK